VVSADQATIDRAKANRPGNDGGRLEPRSKTRAIDKECAPALVPLLLADLVELLVIKATSVSMS